MDEPQNPKKPIDEVLKDLYGPSDDFTSDQSVDQSKPLTAGQFPGQLDAQATETPPQNPPVDELPSTGSAFSTPDAGQTLGSGPLPSQPINPPTDYLPPVSPIIGVDNAQPPWVESTTPSTEDNLITPSEPSLPETNYPQPPAFRTTIVDEPAEVDALPQTVPDANGIANGSTESQTTSYLIGVEGGHTNLEPVDPDFVSPLPPRPEPEFVSTAVPVAPPGPVMENIPAKKSKLLLLLPFIAIIAIGLAVLLFVKSKKTPTSSGPVSLTYWGLFEPNSVFQQVIADYETANPSVKIGYQQQSGLKEYRDRLTNAIGKEGGPDIFRIHLSWVPMFTDNLSVIPSSIYSTSDFEKDYYPSAISALKTPKGLVGLPVYFDSLALFYNEDLFRAAGQNPPSTWEDLIKTACTLTVRDQTTGRIKTGGVALGSPANVDHWSDILGLMLLQNDADPAIPDACNDQGVCPGKDALTFFTSFIKNSACRNSEGAFLGSSWSDLLPTSTYAFATSQVAMYFAPSWRVFDLKNLNPNLNFKIVPVPQLTNEVKDKVAWATYWVESVSGNSTNPTEAWKFLKYLSSREVLEKLYLAQSNLGNPRVFGEPYPRVEMASMLVNDPWVGPFIAQAPFAQNWYLSSFTSDNGINDSIIKYYEDAVNQAISGQDTIESLVTVTQGIAQVLSRYGVQPTTR